MKNLNQTPSTSIEPKSGLVIGTNLKNGTLNSVRPFKLVKKQSLTKKLSIKPISSLRRSR